MPTKEQMEQFFKRDPVAPVTDKTNPKEILGATKPMLGLNPPVALIWMAKAFEFGAHGRDANGVQVRPKGYGEFNWRETEIAEMVYIHAIGRHWCDYLDGEDVASDSKVKHLAHIMACCAILLDAEECGTLKRNRPKKGKASDVIERLTVKRDDTKTVQAAVDTGQPRPFGTYRITEPIVVRSDPAKLLANHYLGRAHLTPAEVKAAHEAIDAQVQKYLNLELEKFEKEVLHVPKRPPTVRRAAPKSQKRARVGERRRARQ